MGGSVGGISVGCVGSRGGVYCVIIIHVPYVTFKKISVSSFSPDDRKWASGVMAVVAATVEIAAPGVDSFSRVTGRLVASFAES